MRMTWSWQSFDCLTTADLHDILRLRQNAFIIEQASCYADIDGRDPEAWHLMAHANDGRLAASLRAFPATDPASETTVGRFVVAPWARGRGLAREMMDRCLHWTFIQSPGSPIRISAQRHLEGFYRQFGFKTRGAPFDDAGVLHVDMIRPTSGQGSPL